MSELTAIVLAAGQGTRMKSALPKVLHPIVGRPLVHYSVAAALEAGATRVVVVVSRDFRDAVGEALVSDFGESQITLTVQEPPLGTGDAARVGLEEVDSGRVLILYGDTPLLSAADLRELADALTANPPAELALMSCLIDDPAGYGRVLRDGQQRVLEVREDRDLESDEQRGVREVNAGMYVADAAVFKRALSEVRPNNVQGEYYLTDVVAVAARGGGALAVVAGADNLVGVNDRAQLAAAESEMYRRIAERHARAGVTVRAGALIDDTVTIEEDATIEAGVSLRGKTRVLQGATIDVGCVVTDSEIGEAALLKPYCVVTESVVEKGARLGPFAQFRAGTTVE